ncbi:MAG: tRNA (adenosine(37)-N6)-dimethylallyltransferase MiaA [Desulfovibrionaceae bacterium]|nr:tRNA (adenosine(37)-N6)-dimethylallyltransferase MiaA [Desulfovibrionaceae bacterium]
MSSISKPDVWPVICLAGPTCCGKTGLALKLAELLPCEVINTDSRQVYRDFPIISAQPTLAEQSFCPHHLYGFLPTESKISAGEWLDLAHTKIREVLARNHVPLLVGGTGMYFHALLHGIAPIPAIDPRLRAELEMRVEEEGVLKLYHEVESLDPDYAKRIHPHDRQRVVRALEVFRQTGKTFSYWHSQTSKRNFKCQGPLLVLQVDLEWLKPRLEMRIREMLKMGALEEVKNAWANCPLKDAPGWSAIGGLELLAYLQGRLDLEEVSSLWLKNTRAYAKRQNTWFRGRKEAQFFKVDNFKELILCAVDSWQKIKG